MTVGRSICIAIVISAVAIGISAATEGCTPGQRQVARTVLDIANTLCIVANQALPDEEVAKVCGLAGPLIAPMKEVLAGSRSASAQAVAGARVGVCGGADAGTR